MKTQTTEAPKTQNYLSHTIDCVTADGNALRIKIKLADECKNGHADFSITGTMWNGTTNKSDRNCIAGGCIHDDILKARPDLKMFVDLHLSDHTGAPMYAVENGYYFLTTDTEKTTCEQLRITHDEYVMLKASSDKMHFWYLLQTSGIVERWAVEANKAIEALETMTGYKYVDTSVKRQFYPLAAAQIEEITQKQQSGYFAPEKIEERKNQAIEAKKQKQLSELLADRNKAVKKADDEYNVKVSVLQAGLPLDNFIYYNHSNEGCFNWMDGMSYKKVTAEELEAFLKAVDYSKLPTGIVFKLK